jgi:hypothetical protein
VVALQLPDWVVVRVAATALDPAKRASAKLRRAMEGSRVTIGLLRMERGAGA